MRTKKELIDALAERTQQPKNVSEAFIDALGDALRASLAGGDEVVLPGVGKFSVKAKAAKTGRNPRTGEAIQIAARKAPAFSAAKVLKDAVDAK
ncbi:HU family DNA-binding protein [Pigmentiphaga litoralis]|jgi:DNA-binding protein HU-beta|uniref:DNA-binding protein HU-beta n=1 Tax=Pigmentiphaga litoralis TaxID=516702 RepID=A0A7Y9LNT6_9BURK|nr:HU family DNA-binding protein [Pigmentiphaga litoralis]NYE22745.1 DNA-binding protein HU-beta [Pigmentiphaga litoralis]NYE83640.1 DNA-binding protein HU-beta [Pigmentiphaga litoralis]GGX07061.1 DNA-binding protein HU-beta [Pigmentiphaga litoralis]